MADFYLKCADCGYETVEDQYYVNCSQCEGFLNVQLRNVDASTKPDSNYSSIFKYHPFMPFDVQEADLLAHENFEDTPTFFAEQISNRLDVELYCKDETVFPTGTWKDREGFVSIYRLWKNNISDMVLFSSGNTGTSLARSASLFKGPRLHLFVPKSSKNRIQSLTKFYHPDFVEIHYGDGSNDECIVQAKAYASDSGLAIEGGFRNYARREGLKLLGLEYIFGLGVDNPVDWYVQAVAGGIGVYSFYKAHCDTGRADACPRILGVQAEACSPMVNAWKDDSATLEDRHIPQEIVASDFVRVLRTRKPADSYPILKPIMDQVDGQFECASDDGIYEALRLFYLEDYYKKAHGNGIVVGLEAATALAGIVRGIQHGYIQKGAKVLLNVSGAAKAGDVKSEWIEDLLN